MTVPGFRESRKVAILVVPQAARGFIKRALAHDKAPASVAIRPHFRN
jgi:hypothetical protein